MTELIKKIKTEKCPELNDLINMHRLIRDLLKEAMDICNKFKESDKETIKSMLPFFEEMKIASDKQKANLYTHGWMRVSITSQNSISPKELTELIKENKNITVGEAFKKKFGQDYEIENPIYFIPLGELPPFFCQEK